MIDTGINDVNKNPALKESTYKLLLYVGIGSMIMLFAGLTSAYIVSKGGGDWINFKLPATFSFSTAILLISSLTMNIALQSIKKDNIKTVQIALIITFILGIAFTVSQYYGWGALYANKVYFTGKGSNAAGSFMYVLTGLHVAHLFGGLIYLITCITRNAQHKFTSQSYLSLKMCAIYWHFLDILWIYLFLFLLFKR